MNITYNDEMMVLTAELTEEEYKNMAADDVEIEMQKWLDENMEGREIWMVSENPEFNCYNARLENN